MNIAYSPFFEFLSVDEITNFNYRVYVFRYNAGAR